MKIKYVIIFWLTLSTMEQRIVPCSEFKVINSTVSVAQACIEVTKKIVWRKDFKKNKDAEDYLKTAVQAPGYEYTLEEQ